MIALVTHVNILHGYKPLLSAHAGSHVRAGLPGGGNLPLPAAPFRRAALLHMTAERQRCEGRGSAGAQACSPSSADGRRFEVFRHIRCVHGCAKLWRCTSDTPPLSPPCPITGGLNPP